MKQAVILAAGAGVRLKSISNGSPKCLITVGGRALIEHQLLELRELGITRVCVVLGYQAQQVRSVLGSSCHYVTNEQYAQTNSLYSLWLARQWVSGPFMLLNSDVLAHPAVYQRVASAGGAALAYDSSSGQAAEHMKVTIEDDLVRALGKDLPASQTHGENLGILHFDAKTAPQLFSHADALIESGQVHSWAPAAVDRLVRKTAVRGIDVAGLPWVEVDFPEDYLRANCTIWPLIGQVRCSVVCPPAESTLRQAI